jgi:hypothetical protein
VVEVTHAVTEDKTESSLNVIVGIFVLITLVRLAGLATSNVDLFTHRAADMHSRLANAIFTSRNNPPLAGRAAARPTLSPSSC